MSLVILLGMSGALSGSTVAPLTFNDLSAKAHRITIGRIDRIISQRDANGVRIVSKIDLTETHSVSGAAPATFSFTMDGGTLDGIRQSISGFPSFTAGDRVVLFLAEDTSTPFGPTLGLWQGVFFVQTDANGVETVTDHQRRPLAELRGDQVVRAGQPDSRVTLEAFLDKVRSLRGSR
jgi:hypothetical protein